jgi:hypothetical protein
MQPAPEYSFGALQPQYLDQWKYKEDRHLNTSFYMAAFKIELLFNARIYFSFIKEVVPTLSYE